MAAIMVPAYGCKNPDSNYSVRQTGLRQVISYFGYPWLTQYTVLGEYCSSYCITQVLGLQCHLINLICLIVSGRYYKQIVMYSLNQVVYFPIF